jgi:hypothetical protein
VKKISLHRLDRNRGLRIASQRQVPSLLVTGCSSIASQWCRPGNFGVSNGLRGCAHAWRNSGLNALDEKWPIRRYQQSLCQDCQFRYSFLIDPNFEFLVTASAPVLEGLLRSCHRQRDIPEPRSRATFDSLSRPATIAGGDIFSRLDKFRIEFRAKLLQAGRMSQILEVARMRVGQG